jgi:glutamine synthetase
MPPASSKANLRHQQNPLSASDHAIFLRQIVKAAAATQRYDATFMAKPYRSFRLQASTFM